jgi:integrase
LRRRLILDTKALVYSGAYMGLRWAELGGLLRKNLDLLRCRIKVVGSLERFRGGNRYVEETKSTASRRVVPIPAFLVEVLTEHLTRVPASEWVFPAPKVVISVTRVFEAVSGAPR